MSAASLRVKNRSLAIERAADFCFPLKGSSSVALAAHTLR